MSEPEACNGSCGPLSSLLLSSVGGRVISGTPSVLPIGGTPEQNLVRKSVVYTHIRFLPMSKRSSSDLVWENFGHLCSGCSMWRL